MRTRVARIVEHGQPLSVEEVDLPDPGDGETLVDLAFSGVNPVDRYQAMGLVASEVPLPRGFGSEAAGRLPEGRAVFVNGAALARGRDGLFADRAVVNPDLVIDVPEGVPLEVAASAGVAGATAWRCVVDVACVNGKDRVLVLGATGGVGGAIVSLASSIGADVVAQTGSEAKRGPFQERFSTTTIVAGSEELGDALGDFSPTVVFDPLGASFTGVAIAALAERGRLVLFGTSAGPTGEVPLQPLYRKAIEVKGYAGMIEPPERIRDAVTRALHALAEERMQIAIDSVLELEEIDTAFDRIAGRKLIGKQVIRTGDG